jgi:hypothetical protein
VSACQGDTECPSENTLGRLGEGRLDAEERASVEAHLDGCAACTLLLRELGAALDAGESAESVSAQSVEMVDRLPNRYRINGRLGAGGMGVVYAAFDRHLRRRVALKLLRADAGADERSRLLREARLLAGLSHPNVMTVLDAGEAGEGIFVSMPLLEGRTARRWCDDEQPRASDVLRVYRDAGAGLAAAHAAGVIHRDVKPDNILVGNDGRVLLTDFGLATVEEAHAGELTTLTQRGQFLGTPSYTPPEQLRGEHVDARSDQFAFCVSLWEALAGARPFEGDSVAALAVAMTRPPLPVSRSDVRAALWRVLRRGLCAERDERWPSMNALLSALDATAQGPTGPRRAAVFAVIAGLAAALVLAARRPDRERGSARAESPDAALSSRLDNAEPSFTPTPLNLATAPADAVASAAISMAAPERVTAAPERVTAAPERVTAAPERVTAAPERVTAAPERVTAAPERVTERARPADTANFHVEIAEASALFYRGDARACLARAEAAERRWPVSDADHPHAKSGLIVAMCKLATGDCDGGRERLATALRESSKQPDEIARQVKSWDAFYCPPDTKGTAEQGYERLSNRITAALKDARPCFDWVARARALSLPYDARRAETLDVFAAQCPDTRAGCGEALREFADSGKAAKRSDPREAGAWAESFYQARPDCRPQAKP